MEATISDLCRWTGLVYRTIRGRLEAAGITPTRTEGRSIYYDSIKALQAIYGGGDEGLDLSTERALLAAEQRRKLERENNIAEGLVAPVSRITEVLTSVAAQMVPLLEALPLQMKRANPKLTGHDIMVVTKCIARCRNAIGNIKEIDDDN